MQTLEQIETYISQLIYQVPGFDTNCYQYIDSGADFQALIAEFFSTKNPDGRPSLLFACYEAPVKARLGLDFQGGFNCDLLVVSRVDISEHPQTLIKARSDAHILISKVLGKMMVDQEEQPTGQYRWAITLDDDEFVPQSNLAGSNIYGYSFGFNISINVNNLMFN